VTKGACIHAFCKKEPLCKEPAVDGRNI